MTPAAAPAYLDNSALMRWAEGDIPSPTALNHRVRTEMAKQLQSGRVIAMSELTLIEYRSVVATNCRLNDVQRADFDTAWGRRARVSLMTEIAEGRITVIQAPSGVAAHAMILMDLASDEHQEKLGAWDAIHLLTATSWAHQLEVVVDLLTTDDDFEKFVGLYPSFGSFVNVVNLDTATAP